MRRNRRKVRLVAVSAVPVVVLLIGLVALAQTKVGSRLIARVRNGIGVLRMSGAPAGPAQAVFREYVLDPIPQSATNIRADRTHAVFGYGYTFRFAITPADLALILDSRPFEELVDMEYHKHSTSLTWKLGSGPRTSMLVYSPGQRRPSWFKPENLNSPQGYALPEGGWDIRVLIYDAQTEGAYLIIRRR